MSAGGGTSCKSAQLEFASWRSISLFLAQMAAIWGTPVVALTSSGRQHVAPEAKKMETLRWSADQGQTGRVPGDSRPPVVTQLRHWPRSEDEPALYNETLKMWDSARFRPHENS
jgi:hypothetical protein